MNLGSELRAAWLHLIDDLTTHTMEDTPSLSLTIPTFCIYLR